MSKILCDPYIWENPTVLFQTPMFPNTYTRCVSERLNQVILVALVFGALGLATSVKMDSRFPLYVAFAFGFIVTYKSLIVIMQMFQYKEGFNSSEAAAPNVDIIGPKNRGVESKPVDDVTMPTAKNPFMNVLIDELKYNPKRPAAASVLDPQMRNTMDDFFRTEFYSDPTDVFGKNQGQRQFITMPSTSIPNDVDSFQNWLYRIPGKTCKEGGREACLPGTDGAALPWLNQESRLPVSDEESENSDVNRYPVAYNGTGSTAAAALGSA